jgi:capsular exopolysaccharide synthesis family protein
VENGSVESVSLADYIGVVWRRKWIVIIVTLLVGGAAAIYAKHQQTLYASTATVVFNPGANASPTSPTSKSGQAGNWGAQYLDLANSQDFYRLTIARMSPQLSPAATAADLQQQTKVAATADGNGLQFTVSDPSGARAQTIASALARWFPAEIDGNPPLTKAQATIAQLKVRIATRTTILAGQTPPVTCANDPKCLLLQTQLATTNELAVGYQNSPPSSDVAAAATSTKPGPASTAVQTQPAVTKTVVIGLFAGFILGVILAFLQDVLDTRIRDVEGVGRRLRMPLLTQVPSPPKGLQGLVSMAEPGPALMHSAEAYRIGKLNLSAAIDRAGARSVMFTSGNNGEGASQTVANLAVVMARSGKHVILVDANMRHSEQGDFFGLDDRAGLSDVLSGNAKLADALTAVDVSRPGGAIVSEDGTQRGGLEVLPAGSRAGDPAELLDSAAARDLIVALEERADLVLVDAPALLPVTDAMVLSSKVDAVVVVARAHRASRPTIVALRRALDACPARAIGFVFTGASLGRRFDYGGSFAAASSGKTSDEFDPREIGVL